MQGPMANNDFLDTFLTDSATSSLGHIDYALRRLNM